MLLVLLLFNVFIQSIFCYVVIVFTCFICQISLNKNNLLILIFFGIFFLILLISKISHQLKTLYIKNEITSEEKLRLKNILASFLLNDLNFMVISNEKIIIEIINKNTILFSRIFLETVSDKILSLIIYIKLNHINNYQYILITALNNCNKVFYLIEFTYNKAFELMKFLENLLSSILKIFKLIIYAFYILLIPVIITFKLSKLLLRLNNKLIIQCYKSQIKQYLQVKNEINQQDYLSILSILQNDFKGDLT